VEEKLLKLRELRIALAGPGCPFSTPPAPGTIREWVRLGLKTHTLPGRRRRQYLLSDVLAFLKQPREGGR